MWPSGSGSPYVLEERDIEGLLAGVEDGSLSAAVAALTLTVGYGDKAPKTFGGRVVGFIWMFTAIIVISFFTAAIASSLTVTRLDSRVGGPEDLPQARVGTLSGSAATAYLTGNAVPTVTFASIPEGLGALARAEIDAFVHDQPILRYLSRNEFSGRTRVVPGAFQEQYYAIVLPAGSERRDEVNAVLLEYVAGEEWAALRRRHLGDD
jgi:ABC-type amino acid transport substrate-binding protein